MEANRDTPPHTEPRGSEQQPESTSAFEYVTPTSMRASSECTASQSPPRKVEEEDDRPASCGIPDHVTQATVDATPELKRLQQDLLILTSFNENETLHWRPSWFSQKPHSESFWTLYNPPDVVTEQLPHSIYGRLVYTRRMRRPDDPYPTFPKTRDQWNRICDMRGIPRDFLSKEQVRLMRLGLPRDEDGVLCAPPSYPTYPEPQPRGQGRYLLNPAVYDTHLPSRFHGLKTTGPTEDVQVVVVHSDGALRVEQREDFFFHGSQWTHYDGRGGYTADGDYSPDFNAPKDQSKGRRWSYLPWTKEQEDSCKTGLKLKLRFWNSALDPEPGMNTPLPSS